VVDVQPAPRDELFVGRRAELAALRGALAAAAAGRGRIVLLVGEPGIGKSRLAEAFEGWARVAGAEVLAGRCFEGPGAPAFWPWAQVLRA
jgi:predicted ATPase